MVLISSIFAVEATVTVIAFVFRIIEGTVGSAVINMLVVAVEGMKPTVTVVAEIHPV
jgi:hypothetical protein